MDKKWKNKNFISALKNALNGIKFVYKNERNFKIQIVCAILAIIACIILNCNFVEFGIIIIMIFLVFFAEFINTLIETTIDMITEEYNEKAKIVKDVAAGSVTLISIGSVIVGIIILLPKVLEFLKI